jgi:putative hemolysin
MSPTLGLVAAGLGALCFAMLLAVMAGGEQAFLSLTEAQVRRLRDRGNGRGELILEYVRNPNQVIVTSLLASGVFAAGAVLCLLILVAAWWGTSLTDLLVPGLVAALVLAVGGRVLPRALVSVRPEGSALLLVRAYSVVDVLFRPFTWLVRRLLSRISEDVSSDFIAAEEFKAVAEESEETPRLEDEKRELLHSIFEFGDTTAKEVMVPRIDMIMAEASTPRREILGLVAQHGHSRIPVYDGSVDKIIGVVHVKQLIDSGRFAGDDTPVREFVRPVMFVPETKKIDELLREFQEKKSHLAIVVDEYGGTAGMATLEDVLEELVGEIEDETDTGEILFEAQPDGSYLVAAKIDLDDLNEQLSLHLPTENSDTLGGFIYELVGKVPTVGEKVDYNGLRFLIDRVHRQRIVRVRIERVGQAES